jgi:hypothetical protein
MFILFEPFFSEKLQFFQLFTIKCEFIIQNNPELGAFWVTIFLKNRIIANFQVVYFLKSQKNSFL